jgi:hypothetical protein
MNIHTRSGGSTFLRAVLAACGSGSRRSGTPLATGLFRGRASLPSEHSLGLARLALTIHTRLSGGMYAHACCCLRPGSRRRRRAVRPRLDALVARASGRSSVLLHLCGALGAGAAGRDPTPAPSCHRSWRQSFPSPAAGWRGAEPGFSCLWACAPAPYRRPLRSPAWGPTLRQKYILGGNRGAPFSVNQDAPHSLGLSQPMMEKRRAVWEGEPRPVPSRGKKVEWNKSSNLLNAVKPLICNAKYQWNFPGEGGRVKKSRWPATDCGGTPTFQPLATKFDAKNG